MKNNISLTIMPCIHSFHTVYRIRSNAWFLMVLFLSRILPPTPWSASSRPTLQPQECMISIWRKLHYQRHSLKNPPFLYSENLLLKILPPLSEPLGGLFHCSLVPVGHPNTDQQGLKSPGANQKSQSNYVQSSKLKGPNISIHS